MDDDKEVLMLIYLNDSRNEITTVIWVAYKKGSVTS